jgi:hypothetical protein
MVIGVTCGACGAGLTFTDKGASCERCLSKWPEAKVRKLYLALEPGDAGVTDRDWWAACVDEVRKVLCAAHDDAAVEILRKVGWDIPANAVELRRLAGISQTEHRCPRCKGSGKVMR